MINFKAYRYRRGQATSTSYEVWLMHTEAHEDIILEHIDGSLDEKNVSEALHLLRQCGECKRIYEKSLMLRSKLQPANILNYLETKTKPAAVAEKPRLTLWGAWLWRPLAAAMVILLAAAFPLSWYVERLQTRLGEKERTLLAEKEEIKAELAKMQEKIRSWEATGRANDGTKPPPLDDKGTGIGSMASAAPIRGRGYVSVVELRLSEVRGQVGHPADSPLPVRLSKDADDWHLIIVSSEESEEKD